MKDSTESVFMPLFNNITQIFKHSKGKGIIELVKDIGGSICKVDVSGGQSKFHMNQLEVGYCYILYSGTRISVILPLMKKHNECSYTMGTIIQTPSSKGERYWSNPPVTIISSPIREDSYWTDVWTALKIPTPISKPKFINWINRNPMEVKD